MAVTDIQELIITLGSQLLIIGSGLLATYFKLRSDVQNKISEVKTHTDVILQKLNGMLTYVIHSFDRPAWIKIASYRNDGEIEFRMLELNELYTETFGISRHEYLGKTDLEAGWDRKTAEIMRDNDLRVWASGEAETLEENVGGSNLKIRKMRLQTPNGLVKGVMGYVIE